METCKIPRSPPTVARYLRDFSGLSMTDLADILGVPFLTVFNIEHHRETTIGTLRRFAQFFWRLTGLSRAKRHGNGCDAAHLPGAPQHPHENAPPAEAAAARRHWRPRRAYHHRARAETACRDALCTCRERKRLRGPKRGLRRA